VIVFKNNIKHLWKWQPSGMLGGHALITLMMEAVCTSETSVNFYETTRRNIPQDCHLHTRLRENLQSNINHLIFVMEKFCVFFEVRTESLNIIWFNFGFKALTIPDGLCIPRSSSLCNILNVITHFIQRSKYFSGLFVFRHSFNFILFAALTIN
jgi:hypothetical protein